MTCGLEGDEPSRYHGALPPGGEQGASIPAQGTAGSGQCRAESSKAEPGQQGLAAAPLPLRKRAALPSIRQHWPPGMAGGAATSVRQLGRHYPGNVIRMPARR